MTSAALLPEYVWRGARGLSLAALIGDADVRLDAPGARSMFSDTPKPFATIVEGARLAPSTFDPEVGREPRPLGGLLEGALPQGDVALALSGGVDSAVLAALLGRRAVAYTLTTNLPGYGEETGARALARHLGLELRLVPANEDDLLGALDDALSACERPLYNLHPVSRWLLARAARADGLTTLVTGDGADEVFHGRSGADYLPIVGALGRTAGVSTTAPFVEASVAPFIGKDPEKRALRALALELGLPARVALGPKRARYAPACNLTRLVDPRRVGALGGALGIALDRASERETTGLFTLSLLVRRFPGLRL